MIIQTDHSAIINILQQSSITSTTSTMRLNLRLVRASQFLQQFKLDVRHKPGKEHIVPDTLSWLASANTRHPDPQHSELDALFTYNTTLVEMHPALVSWILADYQADPWWAQLHRQIQANDNLGADSTTLPFVGGSMPPADSDPYLTPRPAGDEDFSPRFADVEETPEGLPAPDKSRLLYHVNRITNVNRLYIPPSVAPDILAVVHGEGHLGFSCCYEIISRSWYIRGLTKLLQAFIRHSLQCLALQTRRHALYGSLQPIKSPPVPFFTLTLDFVLVFPLSKEKYNAIISVTYKLSKRVTLIEGTDTWSAE